MASGIARGRVRTTTTTESHNMAAILQKRGWQRHTALVYCVLLWYWTTTLRSIIIDTCQFRVSADQYHVAISRAQVPSWNNFGKSLEIFGKWLEIFRKSSKTASSACLCNRKNITRLLKDMNFMFSWQELYLMSECSERVRYSSCHENIKFICSRHLVISSISPSLECQ